jgi:hypothetical protein
VRPEGLGNLIKIFHLIGSRTRDIITITITIICSGMCAWCSPMRRDYENKTEISREEVKLRLDDIRVCP